MALWVIVLGGGDLASGVAWRLYKSGMKVIMTELPTPTMVRRKVSFGEAVYCGEVVVEGVAARRAGGISEALEMIGMEILPVMVDPDGEILDWRQSAPGGEGPLVLVDARMRKTPPDTFPDAPQMVIGLGPGFSAGVNCHAVVETNRGHFLGRVIWQGEAEKDTGIPEQVQGYGAQRVLRSPADGVIEPRADIGDRVLTGQTVAYVSGIAVNAPFGGVLRGLIHAGLHVKKGAKIGDVDPRDNPNYCVQISDKALAIAGGVMEAILSQPGLRSSLCSGNEAG